MFTNPISAREYGQKIEAEMIEGGAHPTVAGVAARIAEQAELRRLNKWTTENVGLD